MTEYKWRWNIQRGWFFCSISESISSQALLETSHNGGAAAKRRGNFTCFPPIGTRQGHGIFCGIVILSHGVLYLLCHMAGLMEVWMNGGGENNLQMHHLHRLLIVVSWSPRRERGEEHSPTRILRLLSPLRYFFLRWRIGEQNDGAYTCGVRTSEAEQNRGVLLISSWSWHYHPSAHSNKQNTL
jgi:hypothetical protein